MTSTHAASTRGGRDRPPAGKRAGEPDGGSPGGRGQHDAHRQPLGAVGEPAPRASACEKPQARSRLSPRQNESGRLDEVGHDDDERRPRRGGAGPAEPVDELPELRPIGPQASTAYTATEAPIAAREATYRAPVIPRRALEIFVREI